MRILSADFLIFLPNREKYIFYNQIFYKYVQLSLPNRSALTTIVLLSLVYPKRVKDDALLNSYGLG